MEALIYYSRQGGLTSWRGQDRLVQVGRLTLNDAERWLHILNFILRMQKYHTRIFQYD